MKGMKLFEEGPKKRAFDCMFFERSFLFHAKECQYRCALASDRVLEWCGTQLQASVFVWSEGYKCLLQGRPGCRQHL